MVLDPEDPATDGIRVAEELMTKLEIRRTDLIESAYVDLMTED